MLEGETRRRLACALALATATWAVIGKGLGQALAVSPPLWTALYGGVLALFCVWFAISAEGKLHRIVFAALAVFIGGTAAFYVTAFYVPTILTDPTTLTDPTRATR